MGELTERERRLIKLLSWMLLALGVSMALGVWLAVYVVFTITGGK